MYSIISSVLCTLFVYIITWEAIKRTPEYEKYKGLKSLMPVIIATFLTSIMIFRYGLSITMLKGVFMAIVLMYASFSDIQIRRVSDSATACIFMLGIAGVSFTTITHNFLFAIATLAFFLISAIVSNGKIGGADIKLMSALNFVAGLYKGLPALILSLFISVVATLVIVKRNKKSNTTEKILNTKLPMVPYLAVGYILMYLI